MARGRRKEKISFSKIYSFACGKASLKDDHHSEIGGPGFSRVVYCNEPNSFEAGIKNYVSNYVRTTKYTLVTFLPKSLFEQFRRVANFFFLVTGTLAFTKFAPYTAVSAIIPLIVVIGAAMIKEGIEDWRRYQQVLFASLVEQHLVLLGLLHTSYVLSKITKIILNLIDIIFLDLMLSVTDYAL